MEQDSTQNKRKPKSSKTAAVEVKNPNEGHRDRLRERFLRGGLKPMHDYEQLELLLTYVIPRKDVKPIARDLLNKLGGFTGVCDASLEELCSVPGIGKNSAVLIMLLKELAVEYLRVKMNEADVLSSPDAVASFARMKLGGLKHESFMTIFLNTKNRVITFELQDGTVDRAAVYPRDVIKKALELHAVSLILVHNHPSGICDPSKEDIKLTQNLKAAAATVNIKILDHLVVSKFTHKSLAEDCLI
ncbi:MAG: DNA repair protein RadC [Victivallaceae bacterium]